MILSTFKLLALSRTKVGVFVYHRVLSRLSKRDKRDDCFRRRAWSRDGNTERLLRDRGPRSRVLLANTKVGSQVMALSVHLHAFHFSFQPKLNSLVDDKMINYHQGCAQSPGACFARPRGTSNRALSASRMSIDYKRAYRELHFGEGAVMGKALECADIEKARRVVNVKDRRCALVSDRKFIVGT